jgi:hypothetical protein
MRVLNLILVIALPSLLLSQNEGVISIKENDFLYRGYNNFIDVGLNVYCDDSVWLECTNCETAEWKGHRSYIIRPLEERKTTLSIMRFDGENVFTVSSEEFRVRDLPGPEIMFNSYWRDEKISLSELKEDLKRPVWHNDTARIEIHTPRLHAQYGPEKTMEAKFSVKNWNIQIHNETFTGKGSTINANLLEYLINLEFEEPVYMKLETNVLGPDGKERFVTTLFELVP